MSSGLQDAKESIVYSTCTTWFAVQELDWRKERCMYCLSWLCVNSLSRFVLIIPPTIMLAAWVKSRISSGHSRKNIGSLQFWVRYFMQIVFLLYRTSLGNQKVNKHPAISIVIPPPLPVTYTISTLEPIAARLAIWREPRLSILGKYNRAIEHPYCWPGIVFLESFLTRRIERDIYALF